MHKDKLLCLDTPRFTLPAVAIDMLEGYSGLCAVLPVEILDLAVELGH